MDEIEYLKRVTGETDTELLAYVYKQAKETVLAETNRTLLIPPLEQAVLSLAVYSFSTMYNLGESSRSEGGVSVTYTTGAPENVQRLIRKYRLAKIGGRVFEKKNNS